ncbi:MAG: hypothetical protein IPJ77_08045 [Planctomycetes bacterium]|nr:hypothetical protein [Planctomycetota bacterium]
MKRAFASRSTVPARSARRGMALVIVLVVLLVLLVLATPFLLMARNADSASSAIADRVEARIALDTAGRHARAVLAESHSTADATPYWDARDEVAIDNALDPAFLDANDPNGAQWDAEVEDLAAKIDLNSCPPHVIANLMGVAKRFTDAVAPDSKTLKLNSAAGLEPRGFLWASGELVQYEKLVDNEVVQFTRGVLGPPTGVDWLGGPRPPGDHGIGEPVLDQRAFAPILWRLATPDGRLRPFEALEELRQAGEFELASVLANAEGRRGELDAEELRPLLAFGSVHGGVTAGAVWQHPVRITSPIQGGKDGKLRLASNRWINPGSTVRITDGANTELAVIAHEERTGEVFLDRVLVNDYAAWRAELSVLARRPVNLNTASRPVLVALFANLQLEGRNARILRDEAEKLAELVEQSRPIEGFEDFLRRVVLPAAGLEKLPSDAPIVPEALAAGAGLVTPDKAYALYRNGLNANDGGLAFSTMPYCFTTRDVYEFELRASVSALSGVERARAVRDEVAVVVPQRELLKLWARQEDFDEELRLSTDAPWWTTGPNATTRWDNGASPPSRLWAHMGTAEGQAYLPGVTDTSAFNDRESPPTVEHVFASREKTAWIQLWAARGDEMGERQGRVLHFDHETRDLEGRYLPDQPVRRPTDDTQLRWTEKQGQSGRPPLLKPLALDLWVKPRSLDAGRLLDVGGSSQEIDRLSLLLEGEDLVLRVQDGVGDHPETEFKEVGEVRYQLARGEGPGLPAEVWSHLSVDVRGNRPSQMDLRVNGLAHGVRRPGLTRLTGTVTQSTGELPVESVEGFPPECCVRIGNELVEVLVQNGTMSARRQETGRLAGFGGRTAREQYTSTDTTATAEYPGNDLPADLGTIDDARRRRRLRGDHPVGEPRAGAPDGAGRRARRHRDRALQRLDRDDVEPRGARHPAERAPDVVRGRAGLAHEPARHHGRRDAARVRRELPVVLHAVQRADQRVDVRRADLARGAERDGDGLPSAGRPVALRADHAQGRRREHGVGALRRLRREPGPARAQRAQGAPLALQRAHRPQRAAELPTADGRRSDRRRPDGRWWRHPGRRPGRQRDARGRRPGGPGAARRQEEAGRLGRVAVADAGAESEPDAKDALLLAAPMASVAASPASSAAQYSPNWEPRLGKTSNKDFALSDAASRASNSGRVRDVHAHTPARARGAPRVCARGARHLRRTAGRARRGVPRRREQRSPRLARARAPRAPPEPRQRVRVVAAGRRLARRDRRRSADGSARRLERAGGRAPPVHLRRPAAALARAADAGLRLRVRERSRVRHARDDAPRRLSVGRAAAPGRARRGRRHVRWPRRRGAERARRRGRLRRHAALPGRDRRRAAVPRREPDPRRPAGARAGPVAARPAQGRAHLGRRPFLDYGFLGELPEDAGLLRIGEEIVALRPTRRRHGHDPALHERPRAARHARAARTSPPSPSSSSSTPRCRSSRAASVPGTPRCPAREHGRSSPTRGPCSSARSSSTTRGSRARGSACRAARPCPARWTRRPRACSAGASARRRPRTRRARP